jgi:uncharacterized protein (TIGR00255 family)
MTAFARHALQEPWGELVWELRSVNHRYLEVSPRMPEDFRVLDEPVRGRIAAAVKRGKLEANLRWRASGAAGGELVVDAEFTQRLATASREVDVLLYNPAPVSSLDMMRWPGVVEVHSGDMAPVRDAALGLLDEALQTLVATRKREGARLDATIRERLDQMDKVVAVVRERMPAVVAAMRDRLRARLEELKQQVDAERLEQELVIFAQKVDVDEEMDRLRVHIDETRRVLDGDGAIGRRLDFLMQEMNREANTLGSKSADVDTTRASVDLKVLIEQVREQVQNIE